MIKSVIWCACLVALLAYVGSYLNSAGIFRHIETKGLDKCHLLVPLGGGNIRCAMGLFLEVFDCRGAGVRRLRD